jgi:hypothetical protein
LLRNCFPLLATAPECRIIRWSLLSGAHSRTRWRMMATWG